MRRIARAAFVTDAGSFGGAERYILSMAAACGRAGIEPQIWWLRPRESEEVFSSADESLVVSSELPDRAPAAALSHLIDLIRSLRPDVMLINASGRKAFWLAAPAARVCGTPCAWVHHMIEGRDHRRLPPRHLGGRMEGLHLWRIPQALRHMLAGAAANAVITSNTEDAHRVIRWYRTPVRKVWTIPPGVDCGRFIFNANARTLLRSRWGVTDDTILIGTAARLVSGKGVELLIDAMSRLYADGLRVRAVVAGTGPAAQLLQERASVRGVASCVRFAGFIDDMPGFFSALDIAVLPSETESFGLALTEAMACRRPVVATPTAGARRQIRHLQNGFLLRWHSSCDLADALEMLCGRPELRERLADAGYRTVRSEFSSEVTLARTLAAAGAARRRLGESTSHQAGPQMRQFLRLPDAVR